MVAPLVGIIYVIPAVEKMVRMDMLCDDGYPPQDVITRDNVSVKVNGVLYFRILIQPGRSRGRKLSLCNFPAGAGDPAQCLPSAELDELCRNGKGSIRIQEILDQQTDPWGSDNLVELKHIDLPQEMQRAMAKQAEAERDGAPSHSADGDIEASQSSRKRLTSSANTRWPPSLSAGPGRSGVGKNSRPFSSPDRFADAVSERAIPKAH
jgi:hypothetical protein